LVHGTVLVTWDVVIDLSNVIAISRYGDRGLVLTTTQGTQHTVTNLPPGEGHQTMVINWWFTIKHGSVPSVLPDSIPTDLPLGSFVHRLAGRYSHSSAKIVADSPCETTDYYGAPKQLVAVQWDAKDKALWIHTMVKKNERGSNEMIPARDYAHQQRNPAIIKFVRSLLPQLLEDLDNTPTP